MTTEQIDALTTDQILRLNDMQNAATAHRLGVTDGNPVTLSAAQLQHGCTEFDHGLERLRRAMAGAQNRRK